MTKIISEMCSSDLLILILLRLYDYFNHTGTHVPTTLKIVQSTLVISTSLHLNNRLSRSGNLVYVFSMEILQQVSKYVT